MLRLARVDFTILATQYRGHAVEFTHDLDISTTDGLIIAGGDGLVSEVGIFFFLFFLTSCQRPCSPGGHSCHLCRCPCFLLTPLHPSCKVITGLLTRDDNAWEKMPCGIVPSGTANAMANELDRYKAKTYIECVARSWVASRALFVRKNTLY